MTCRDMDHFESVMDKRIRLMEHIVAGHKVGIGWIEMTRSEMIDSWIHPIDEAMDMEFNLVMV